MPTYYFDIFNGEAVPDLNGTDLAGIQEARVMAVRFLGQVLLEQASAVEPGSVWRVEVRGEGRKPLFTVNVSIEDHPFS